MFFDLAFFGISFANQLEPEVIELSLILSDDEKGWF